MIAFPTPALPLASRGMPGIFEAVETVKPAARSSSRRRRTSGKDRQCHCCRAQAPFCWSCPCGFAICQACMQENLWGLTCNNILWECPDCGRWNGFGNQ